MRIAMEPLTYAAGVDVFFYGASPPSGWLCPAVATLRLLQPKTSLTALHCPLVIHLSWSNGDF